jgi:hypothetical protein
MKKSLTIALENKFRSASGKASFATAIPVFYLLILLMVFVFAGCKKDTVPGSTSKVESQKADKEPLTYYEGLNPQTMFELQEARAATAKYQNIENAFADGFETTPVVVLPNMGYHFRKIANIDGTFDIKNPEILVYNKDDNGKFVLVAVEYAVPFTFSANAPEGFTGSDDVWDHTTAFGLWTLHAWVWKNNPDGVFAPMNPTVQVQ